MGLVTSRRIGHIKEELNGEADKCARIDSRLAKGNLVINGELRIHPLP
jgi:hypothetical protein